MVVRGKGETWWCGGSVGSAGEGVGCGLAERELGGVAVWTGF